nr:PREDICTED: myristoylated alanine-rich C-kinase substrate [Bos mutus]
MGAQFSKTAAKGEATAERPGEAAVASSPSKANGQENGHVKVNGDASPAAAEPGAKEELQANGSAPAADKEEPAAAGSGAARRPPLRRRRPPQRRQPAQPPHRRPSPSAVQKRPQRRQPSKRARFFEIIEELFSPRLFVGVVPVILDLLNTNFKLNQAVISGMVTVYTVTALLFSYDVNSLLEIVSHLYTDLYGHSSALVTDEKTEVKAPAHSSAEAWFLTGFWDTFQTLEC